MYQSVEEPVQIEMDNSNLQIDFKRDRFPCCIVWTPIPLLTWIFPFLGHMGIALSNGVIRDFAGSYYVSEGNMAFGRPTKYWKLNPACAHGGIPAWDRAVTEASEIYKTRLHNLCCDNCHSHVAKALNLMSYKNKNSWNMVKLAFLMLICGKYVSCYACFKTWFPFLFILTVALLISFVRFT